MLILAASAAEATLYGRLPATPGGSDYQAYYDDALRITWLAEATDLGSGPKRAWVGGAGQRDNRFSFTGPVRAGIVGLSAD